MGYTVAGPINKEWNFKYVKVKGKESITIFHLDSGIRIEIGDREVHLLREVLKGTEEHFNEEV